jgi:hypothetical protein
MAAFNFADQKQYSDWAGYAGFDRKTGGMEDSPAKQGIPPPQDFNQYLNQRLQPAQNIMSNAGNVASQVGSGNFVGAMSTAQNMRQPVPPTAAPAAPTAPMAPAAPAVPEPAYQYEFGLDEDQKSSLLQGLGGMVAPGLMAVA